MRLFGGRVLDPLIPSVREYETPVLSESRFEKVIRRNGFYPSIYWLCAFPISPRWAKSPPHFLKRGSRVPGSLPYARDPGTRRHIVARVYFAL